MGTGQSGHTGMITIDPRVLWRSLLTGAMTIVAGVMGWAVSLAWDQQVLNTARLEQLEREKAVLEERLNDLKDDFKEQQKAMWARISTLSSSRERLQTLPVPTDKR